MRSGGVAIKNGSPESGSRPIHAEQNLIQTWQVCIIRGDGSGFNTSKAVLWIMAHIIPEFPARTIPEFNR